jgi:hypothetical protein
VFHVRQQLADKGKDHAFLSLAARSQQHGSVE